MAIQISKDDLKLYKNNVPCECENCLSMYTISKSDAYRVFKGTKHKRFCSRKCAAEFKINTKKVECQCKNCNLIFNRVPSSLSSNNFCSHACSASYNNKLRGNPKPVFDQKTKRTYQVRTPRYCKNCNTDIFSRNSQYCSLTCHAEFRYNFKINEWLSGNLYGMSGSTLAIRRFIRSYLIKKSNNMCSKCGWNEIHPITKKVPLEINHIDGNAANDRPENLEILCPNCHSLTPNYRALNKKSSRVRK